MYVCVYVCVCVCVCVCVYVCVYVCIKSWHRWVPDKMFSTVENRSRALLVESVFFLFSWWSKAINFVLMKGRTTVPVIEEVIACVQTSPISFVAIGKDRF